MGGNFSTCGYDFTNHIPGHEMVVSMHGMGRDMTGETSRTYNHTIHRTDDIYYNTPHTGLRSYDLQRNEMIWNGVFTFLLVWLLLFFFSSERWSFEMHWERKYGVVERALFTYLPYLDLHSVASRLPMHE